MSIKMRMKKTLQVLGGLFMVGGFVFLVIHSSFVTVSPEEPFARDLLGFPIPHPPVWVSLIPFLGFFIGIVFESFSIHGLIGFVISGILFGIGGLLIELATKGGGQDSRQRKTEGIAAKPGIPNNLPDVTKQGLIERAEEGDYLGSGVGQPSLFSDVEPTAQSDEDGGTVEILGEKLDPENYQILYKKAKNHPESLKRDLLGLQKAFGGSLLAAKQALESDLQHG